MACAAGASRCSRLPPALLLPPGAAWRRLPAARAGARVVPAAGCRACCMPSVLASHQEGQSSAQPTHLRRPHAQVLKFAIDAVKAEAFNPKTLFLFGSYTIGGRG